MAARQVIQETAADSAPPDYDDLFVAPATMPLLQQQPPASSGEYDGDDDDEGSQESTAFCIDLSHVDVDVDVDVNPDYKSGTHSQRTSQPTPEHQHPQDAIPFIDVTQVYQNMDERMRTTWNNKTNNGQNPYSQQLTMPLPDVVELHALLGTSLADFDDQTKMTDVQVVELQDFGPPPTQAPPPEAAQSNDTGSQPPPARRRVYHELEMAGISLKPIIGILVGLFVRFFTRHPIPRPR